MTSTNRDGEGSFREVRKRHLILFDPTLHRHDRGWPHSAGRKDPLRDEPRKSAKKPWKTVGILHFPAHCDED